ncbi:MAG: ABC transporter permease [Chloroflexi bacterium]|nr:ABC transporter permease [Chloroflexota bacterium]
MSAPALLHLALRYLTLALLLLVANFALPRALPGDPLDVSAAGELSAAASPLSASARAALRAQYRLDQPLAEQFVGYVSDLRRGDLGWSLAFAAPVHTLIAQRLPWTLGLVGSAVLLAALAGALLGAAAAWRPGRSEGLALAGAGLVAGLPELLIALGLLLVFAVWLGWFPLLGGRSPFAQAELGGLGALLDVLHHLALPAASLVIAQSAAFFLVAHNALAGVRGAPYLRTARGKGLPERRVLIRHAVPNALLPVLTLIAIRAGHAFGGAIVVERIFAVPGLGLLSYEALRARDYPVMQAVFLMAGLGILGATALLEILYRWLDPRTRE